MVAHSHCEVVPALVGRVSPAMAGGTRPTANTGIHMDFRETISAFQMKFHIFVTTHAMMAHTHCEEAQALVGRVSPAMAGGTRPTSSSFQLASAKTHPLQYRLRLPAKAGLV